VADCPLDVLTALAFRAFSHAAIVFLYAHVSGELLLAVLADKVVVRHRVNLLRTFPEGEAQMTVSGMATPFGFSPALVRHVRTGAQPPQR
jgi:hypothetical protein